MNLKIESKVIEVEERKLSNESVKYLKDYFVDDVVVTNPIDYELFLENCKKEYEKDKLELSKEEFDKKYLGEWVVEDENL